MCNRWTLKKNNTGASLIAVLITVIIVGVIGILITHLTIMNIQMKEVESSSKQNFYDTEGVMDDVTVALNEIASKCMQTAYMDIMKNYNSDPSVDLQLLFTQKYQDELKAVFVREGTGHVVPDPSIGEAVGYVANYKLEAIKSKMTRYSANLITQDADADMYVVLPQPSDSTVKPSVWLKNIKVNYQDARGYETTITTDMVFLIPQMNFSGKNLVTEYMKYALIADKKIDVNASNITVDGNVYAGAQGIEAGVNSDGRFTGNVIVTRGDIFSSGGSLNIGNTDKTSRIWAENVSTISGYGDIRLTGNSYIADDLSLNSRGSSITLTGKYYGYNFQKNYPDSGVADTVKDSDFSSAMMVNARSVVDNTGTVRKSKLNISGLDYLMLAGRTYISGGNSGNDVMMGESLAVRADQLAYYVDSSYLDTSDASHVRFTAEGKSAYQTEIHVNDIDSYLNTSKPIISYSFTDNYLADAQTYYYLNFASEKKANAFYEKYWNANQPEAGSMASEYLDDTALRMNNNVVLTLKGDILYRDGSNALKEKLVTFEDDNWNVSGIYWNYAKNLAVTYKSLQLSLTENYAGVNGENVRFTREESGTEVIDKTINPLLEQILKINDIRNDFTNNPTVVAQDSTTGAKVIFVENDNVGDTEYVVPSGTKGIIVATGDVKVAGTFEGMLISGGTVSFASNASVSGNQVLVAGLFHQDAVLENPTFTKYFKDYSTLLENVIGTVEVSDYLIYQNWVKN